MQVYNNIIQKLINNTDQYYSINNAISQQPQPLFTQPPVNTLTYNTYLRHQVWSNIYKNCEISDINSLTKIIYYLYIFNPINNIEKLSNTSNFIISKFRFLNSVFENPFYNTEIHENVLTKFTKIQRTYFALVKFVKICKHKLASIYNTTDILINPISNRSNIIEIYQNRKIYLFTRPDIINILNAALSHSPNFFSEPLIIKNPYNNMVFKKSDLYNFYFFLRNGLFIVSDLIQQFFLSNFELYLFKKNNEFIIREYYIKNYVETTPMDSLCLDIKFMLLSMNISKQIKIHCDFPKDVLIEIMRPYLLLYYQSIYSIDLYKRNACSHELLIRFVKFINFNPKFGRKIITTKKNFRINPCNINMSSYKFKPYRPVYKQFITFNKNHYPFYNKEHNFMNSHTNIKENDSDSEYDSSTDDNELEHP